MFCPTQHKAINDYGDEPRVRYLIVTLLAVRKRTFDDNSSLVVDQNWVVLKC